MNLCLSISSAGTIISLLVCFGQEGLEPHDALSRWEALGKEVNYSELSQLANVIRDATPPADPEVFRRVLGIVQTERHALVSRVRAAELACEIADARGARQVLDNMVQMLDKLKEARAAGATLADADGVPFTHTTILSAFLRRGAKHLATVLEEQTGLLAFLKSYYLVSAQPMEAKSECARLIAECKAPLAARQQAVLEIIEARSSRVPILPTLLRILDGSVFPRLRRMVRAETTPTEFNFAAANALSYLGDEQIVPDLEARRPAFRAVHENREAILRKYVWRIEIQHPPTRILEYIASVDDRGYREMRMWAVQRAHEVGVEPGAIRQAILQHVANASTPLERCEISYVKWIGMELGILHENDLPDVEIRDRRIKP